MRSLQWQVRSRQTLLVANLTLFQKVRRSPQSSPGERPRLAALVPVHFVPGAREPRESSVTSQISQRAKEYLETARALLRAAQTMTDRAIAAQLRALADNCQRRAEKAWHVDATKASARSAASVECEWRT